MPSAPLRMGYGTFYGLNQAAKICQNDAWATAESRGRAAWSWGCAPVVGVEPVLRKVWDWGLPPLLA